MEKKKNTKQFIYSLPYLLSPIYFFSFLFFPTTLMIPVFAYNPSTIITLNCGSAGESPARDGRKWVGDTGTNYTSQAHNPNASITANASQLSSGVDPIPYSTARIFRSQFTYSFFLPAGPKFIRFHFYPSQYQNSIDARESFFSVKVGNFTFLSNFSSSLAARNQNLDSIFKEFCVNSDGDGRWWWLNVTFIPAGGSYAFVNGIEIVSMPDFLYYRRSSDVGIPIVEIKEESMDPNEQHYPHDEAEPSNANEVGEANQPTGRIKRTREHNRILEQRRRQRLTEEALQQHREINRESQRLRILSMTPEQVSQRLQRRRSTQIIRRTRSQREHNLIENQSQSDQQRERRRNYTIQRRASQTAQQREQNLARRRSVYMEQRLQGSTDNFFSRVPRRNRSMRVVRQPPSSRLPTFQTEILEGSTINFFSRVPRRSRSTRVVRRPRLSQYSTFQTQLPAPFHGLSTSSCVTHTRRLRHVPHLPIIHEQNTSTVLYDMPPILNEASTSTIRPFARHGSPYSIYEHGSTSDSTPILNEVSTSTTRPFTRYGFPYSIYEHGSTSGSTPILNEASTSTTRPFTRYGSPYSIYEHGSTSGNTNIRTDERRNQILMEGVCDKWKLIEHWENVKEEKSKDDDMQAKNQVIQLSIYSPGWGFSVTCDRDQLKKLIKREWEEQQLLGEQIIPDTGRLWNKTDVDIYVFYKERWIQRWKSYKDMCSNVTRIMASVAAKQFD